MNIVQWDLLFKPRHEGNFPASLPSPDWVQGSAGPWWRSTLSSEVGFMWLLLIKNSNINRINSQILQQTPFFYNLLHQTPLSFFSLDSAICEAAFCPQTRTQSHEGPACELFSGPSRRPWSLSLTPASSHQFIQPGEQSQLSDIISLQPHHAIISTSTL